jgi:hypothetical protein
MTADVSPRAPSGDFGVLSSPPMVEWGEMARSNQVLLRSWNLSIGGSSLESMRSQARADFLATAREFGCDSAEISETVADGMLWFMTGHQPELYHPGVWAKNFAVSAVAQACGGFGGNLVADTDKFKSNAIRVITGSRETPRVVSVPFDTVDDGRPSETWKIQDESVFRGFAAELISTTGPDLPADALIHDFWPIACAVPSESGSRRFSLARGNIESDWGFGLVESPMGLWSETPQVIRLFLAILADLPRFHDIHDRKLTQYRKERKIHSRNHPVADLVREDDWWEAPLWVWRDESPIRKKLLGRASASGSGIELRIEGETEVLGVFDVTPDRIDNAAVENWLGIASSGVRIRPRALVTTALCRILLTDLFVHGIGGAIYDVLGDAVFGEFFDVRMPRYAVLTATLRLADFSPAISAEERERQIQAKRWLMWQAERICPDEPVLQDLFERKRQWLAHSQEKKPDRRLRASQLRRVNREIAQILAPRIQEADTRIDRLSQSSLAESIVRSREFSIVVHSRERLKRLAGILREMANELAKRNAESA